MSEDSDINVGRIEEDIEILKKFKNDEMQRDKLERDNRCGGWKIGDIYKHLELNTAIEHLINDYTRQKQINEEQQKEIAELKEYIFIAPNLDEMTATNYSIIQREAYIRGRAEEQKNAKQIIHENYIPKQKIKDMKEKIKLDSTIVGGRRNAKTLEYGIKLGKIKACEELLEEGE